MNIPIILAHGALGQFDEVIFFSIAGIFIVMMGISWVKSRTTEFDFDDDTDIDESVTGNNNDGKDHLRLD